jgi:hypothetical protein
VWIRSAAHPYDGAGRPVAQDDVDGPLVVRCGVAIIGDVEVGDHGRSRDNGSGHVHVDESQPVGRERNGTKITFFGSRIRVAIFAITPATGRSFSRLFRVIIFEGI